MSSDLRETQIIVFYLMLVIGGLLIYFTWKLLVHMFSGSGDYLKNEWIEFKAAVTYDWQGMTTANRVIFISVFLLVNYLASFLLF